MSVQALYNFYLFNIKLTVFGFIISLKFCLYLLYHMLLLHFYEFTYKSCHQ